MNKVTLQASGEHHKGIFSFTTSGATVKRLFFNCGSQTNKAANANIDHIPKAPCHPNAVLASGTLTPTEIEADIFIDTE